MHVGGHGLRARAIAVDKDHLPDTRAQSNRHGGRGTDRADTNDCGFHPILLLLALD
jgi:hypothetical protein